MAKVKPEPPEANRQSYFGHEPPPVEVPDLEKGESTLSTASAWSADSRTSQRSSQRRSTRIAQEGSDALRTLRSSRAAGAVRTLSPAVKPVPSPTRKSGRFSERASRYEDEKDAVTPLPGQGQPAKPPVFSDRPPAAPWADLKLNKEKGGSSRDSIFGDAWVQTLQGDSDIFRVSLLCGLICLMCLLFGAAIFLFVIMAGYENRCHQDMQGLFLGLSLVSAFGACVMFCQCCFWIAGETEEDDGWDCPWDKTSTPAPLWCVCCCGTMAMVILGVVYGWQRYDKDLCAPYLAVCATVLLSMIGCICLCAFGVQFFAERISARVSKLEHQSEISEP